ncbi:hypothetical protein BKA70DRAFT_1410071 [Coprinopsis sp. MPI-PUGE-AT-0042]|nr:hypothetical protein BKA70DRAFT_1410071 [Coprinopsis sp. MPI-PUGE-AT-0042]
MAMTLASPSASPSPSVKNESSNNNNSNTSNDESTTTTSTTGATTTAPVDNSTPANNAAAAAAAAAAANIKRKPSRRANTAERRATHNAVERQRRETLNGRFLDLAQLLPNLSQIRRPSKSSIVNSSIAHIHASRRHRMLASRELRQLRAEADALRREVNEWRSRQNLPLVDEPPRSDGFNIIVSGELDVLVAEMGAEMAAQGHGNLVGVGPNGGLMDVEEDEDLDDWGPGPHSSHGGPPPPGSAGGYPGPGGQYDEEVFVPQPPVHHPHHPAAVHQGMMMNGGHPQHHPQHHPMHHHQQQQQQHVPHHMAQGGHPFGYHPAQQGQFAPGSVEDDRHGPFVKNGGNPFAHNVGPRYDSPNGPGPGALFTPPATRDGLPPNGVAGLTSSASSNASGKGGMNINTNVGMVNGGASPAQSVHSSVHSPASHHSGIAMGGAPHHQLVNGDGHTPPPPSAISQHFSARSGSGSPVGSYELASGAPGPAGQPPMERRATYPGPGPAMMYGGAQEMYGHPMHEMQQQQQQQHHRDMRGMPAHDMRGMEMRGGPGMHGGMEMRGHEMRGGHEMRHDMRGPPQMVGAGAGGGLFGMML